MITIYGKLSLHRDLIYFITENGFRQINSGWVGQVCNGKEGEGCGWERHKRGNNNIPAALSGNPALLTANMTVGWVETARLIDLPELRFNESKQRESWREKFTQEGSSLTYY